MSYLSASENVGGITQNISDASCATQYKMAVDSVSGGCGEVNMFIHDSSGDEQSYMPHLSESFFHTKFKIDPNELYTFHDSDVIAGEITVSHTEDNIMFPDNIDIKTKILDNSNKEISSLTTITNGDVKPETQGHIPNGHYRLASPSMPKGQVETKSNARVPKTKSNITTASKTIDTHHMGISSPKAQNTGSTLLNNGPKSSTSNISVSNDKSSISIKSNTETFLDVFKREQGVSENSISALKTEPTVTSIKPPAPALAPKRPPAVKSSQAKPRKGRGPTVHEALQRIPQQHRALPISNTSWHAPGEEMFQCGPLDDKKPNAFQQIESSSSDDDNMPEFESCVGPVCVEESAVETRGARLALRRAAMRRQVARAATSLHLSNGHKNDRALATLIKKQISGKSTSYRLPTQTVNHLLAMRGMTSILTVQERRQLRETGWSGGESYNRGAATCCEDKCTQPPLPCGHYCLTHVTHAQEQRLYAACAAVFAGGERCKQPLLPLQDQTPLCAEHAWKRDNYELLSRENKPKAARKRPCAPPTPRASRPPPLRAPRSRRPKRRKRTAAKRPAAAHSQCLSEINVCSNSSTYDSSEDTAMGALSENEYMTNNSRDLVEVGQVPPDDILDPSVLSQIPDEAFTEFFNQAEAGAPFGESSELAAALEAVLDERVLDERPLDIADVFPHTVHVRNKMVPAVSMEPSTAPS